MSEAILNEGQKLNFLAYSADTKEDDRLYKEGEELTVISLEDESEEPFEYNVKNSAGIESYLFSSEFKVIETEAVQTEEEFEEAEFTEVDETDETDETDDEPLDETVSEEVEVEEAVEPEAPKAEEKPVKKSKAKIASKTEETKIAPKSKVKKVQAPEPEVEEAVKLETQPETALKEDALQGEHIPADETTNYIEKANMMIKELGAEGTIVSLGKQKAFNAFVEGGAINAIITNDEQVKHGYDKGRKGAEQYIEDTFSIKDRVARHRETTFVEFSKMGEAVVAMLVNTNPTKAQYIAAAVKSHGIETEDAIKLLNFSAEKGNSIDDVKAKITEEYVENEDGTKATLDKWTSVRLRVPNDQGEIMMGIVNQVMNENEDMTQEQAFFHIISEYGTLVLNPE